MQTAAIAGEFELPPLAEPAELQQTAAAPEVAASLVAAAHAEAAAIREAARAEGHAAGMAEAHAELEPALAALAEAAHAVAAERDTLADEVEPAAVTLALRIAEQVLGAVLELEPERVVDTVRGALRRLVDRDRVTVLVNPEDLDVVRAASPALLAELGGIEHCEVQAERRVTRGGAVVRTGEGEVDATLETKLQRAREAVADALGR